MRIRSVTVRRKKNLGNYENTDAEVTAELAPGDKPLRVLRDLDALCRQHLDQPSQEEERAQETLKPVLELERRANHLNTLLMAQVQRIREQQAASDEAWRGCDARARARAEAGLAAARKGAGESLAGFEAAAAELRSLEARAEVQAARALLRLFPWAVPLPPVIPMSDSGVQRLWSPVTREVDPGDSFVPPGGPAAQAL